MRFNIEYDDLYLDRAAVESTIDRVAIAIERVYGVDFHVAIPGSNLHFFPFHYGNMRTELANQYTMLRYLEHMGWRKEV